MSEFKRQPTHRYLDPLAQVWLTCAARVGYRVVRTQDAYASCDGRKTLLIAEDAALDPDDCLAQMILHELCHALVEGEAGESRQDWGLDNRSARDIWREHACLRLQAYLAGNVGLREFFAPTTDFRLTFWKSLPADPFSAPAEQGDRRERSSVAARLGAWRASQPRWAQPLRDALNASAAIAAVVTESAGFATDAMPSLWRTTESWPTQHPSGVAPVANYHHSHGCADCAWSFRMRGGLRCRCACTVRLQDDAPACVQWEPASELDCRNCGACCREAYDAVEIGDREVVLKRHPELVITTDTHHKMKRNGDRCAALLGGSEVDQTYTCSIYADRPRSCRDFTLGSANCLDARRRVGLSL